MKLDVGCGLHKRQGYLGIDVNRKDSNADVLCSATQLPFTDAAFTEAYSRRCLQAIENQQAAIDEVQRVLKPGAVFHAVYSGWLSILYYQLTKRRYHGKYPHYKLATKKSVSRLFRGWQILGVWKARQLGGHLKEINLTARKPRCSNANP